MATAIALQQEYTVEVNRLLDGFFTWHTQEAATISPYYGALWHEMDRLAKAGGKRMRSKLTILAYQAFGGEEVMAMLPVAAAQELLHLSMLIHDDIIDRDYVRYGVDNIAGHYDAAYASLVTDGAERKHFAHSAALLAGDLLLSGTYEIIAHSQLPTEKQAQIQRIIARSIFEVAGGELLDTESPFRPLGEISATLVAQYKTASYSFVGPLVAGALLADASEESMVHIRRFAQNIGIAFQLRDDIIGLFGDERKTGKSTTGDLREGKRTYLIERCLQLASPLQREEFERYFGRSDLDADGARVLKELLVATGALRSAEQAIDAYEHHARQALRHAAVPSDLEGRLEPIIRLATRREQ